MDKQPIASIEHHFSDLEDPRIDRTKLHKLLDIVVIAICAVISGADTCPCVSNEGRGWQQRWQPETERAERLYGPDT